MHRINGDKAQMFTDTVQSYGSLMLRCWMWFLGKDLGGAVFTRGMCAASIKALATQSCLTLCNPMDWGLPDSSAQGILQARILEWAAIPFSRGSSQPRDWTQAFCTAGRFFPLSHQGSPVSVFFFFLRSLITENSSRPSIVTRLRSQNFLRPKMASLLSRKPCLVFFFWGFSTVPACSRRMCGSCSKDLNSWWFSGKNF